MYKLIFTTLKKILFISLILQFNLIISSGSVWAATIAKEDVVPADSSIVPIDYFPGGFGLLDTGISLFDGEVYVYGFRWHGQDGRGRAETYHDRDPATKVTGTSAGGTLGKIKNIVQINGVSSGGGAKQIIALSADGNAYGWGENDRGQTGCPSLGRWGDAQGFGSRNPDPCLIMSDVKQVGTGEHHSMILTNDGRVFSFGNNPYGALGLGSRVSYGGRSFAKQVDLNGEFAYMIGVAYEGGFALTQGSDGKNHVWAWGDNEFCGLAKGDVATRNNNTPERIPKLEAYANDIVQISGGNGWGAALLKDGRVINWGWNKAIGINANYIGSSPLYVDKYTCVPRVVTVSGAEGGTPLRVKQLFTYYKGSIVLTENGEVWTWGETTGELDWIYGLKPTKRETIAGVKVIGVGGGKHHVAYKTADNRVFGVGRDSAHCNMIPECRGVEGKVTWPGTEIKIRFDPEWDR